MVEKEPLSWLESVRHRAKELRAEEEIVKDRIRSGFVNRAVIFMDVVGSTDFKQEHIATPEIWILRVRQFSELLSAAVVGSNGNVVKFIGDEVMAVFENVYDAQNLVARIDEIEKNLAQATGYETRIKVAADYGKVYLLTFPGHTEPDPQGPTVDRCARIAAHGQAGEVLASADFAKNTSKLGWNKAGTVDLKGLGPQVIYQLGTVSVDLAPKILILERDFKELQESNQELQFKVGQLKSKNAELAQELEAAGQTPDPSLLAEETENKPNQKWQIIESLLKQLRKTISECPVPSQQYARFLFLWNTDFGENYSKREGKIFDESIEHNLVRADGDGYYHLNRSHPRNSHAISLMETIKDELEGFLAENDPNPDDLFHWTLSDPEFWEKYVDVCVTSY